MKINYRMTFRDHIAFSWYHQSHSPVLMGITGIMAGFLSWESVRNTATEHSTAVVFITWFMLAAILFAFIFFFGFLISILTSISRKNKTFLTDNVVELTETGIISENKYGRTEMIWEIMQNLKLTKRFILIYLAQNKAIVIPIRAFPNANVQSEFFEILQSNYIKDKKC